VTSDKVELFVDLINNLIDTLIKEHAVPLEDGEDYI